MDSLTAGSLERTEVIRPAAILEPRVAAYTLSTLRREDVATGGVWNASASVWQRFDKPWNGVGGTRGDSRLVGTIAVMYDAPSRHEVTIYRVTITAAGTEAGWSVQTLCDDALRGTGLTLASCPRAEMGNVPKADPFRR